jgi:hypothetical protein
MYPIYSLRIWKTGHVFCENRLLDEHMILNKGISIISKMDIIDNPLISLKSWIDKHNKYSDSEEPGVVTREGSTEEIIDEKTLERKKYILTVLTIIVNLKQNYLFIHVIKTFMNINRHL